MCVVVQCPTKIFQTQTASSIDKQQAQLRLSPDNYLSTDCEPRLLHRQFTPNGKPAQAATTSQCRTSRPHKNGSTNPASSSKPDHQPSAPLYSPVLSSLGKTSTDIFHPTLPSRPRSQPATPSSRSRPARTPRPTRRRRSPRAAASSSRRTTRTAASRSSTARPRPPRCRA